MTPLDTARQAREQAEADIQDAAQDLIDNVIEEPGKFVQVRVQYVQALREKLLALDRAEQVLLDAFAGVEAEHQAFQRAQREEWKDDFIARGGRLSNAGRRLY